jgi:type II secretory pathway pseudopilin PulG
VHVLTKVFVVIAAILSVALSALVISYAVNTDRIAAAYQDAVSGRIAAEATAQMQVSLAGQANIRLASEKEQLARENGNLNDRIRSLEQDNSKLLTDKKTAEQERDSITAKISELGETVKTQASLITSYREEVTGLRRSELTFKAREIDLNNDINNKDSQIEVLTQSVRALQEQLVEAKRTASGSPSVGILSGADQPYTYTGPVIRGRVENVSTDPASGKTFAKISVGTNDRAAKNMKFTVVRDGGFIGHVVVLQPDLKWSVAEVVLTTKGTSVQTGDLVQSRND